MEEELRKFLKRRKLSFFSNLYTVLNSLEEHGTEDLLREVEEAMEEFDLDGRNRVSTLLAMLEAESGEENEENGQE